VELMFTHSARKADIERL